MNLEKAKMFTFSPSSLVDFERPKMCVHRWYNEWVAKEVERKTSWMQWMGQYFEYLCLGESPFVGPVAVPTLEKTGKKPVMVDRLEEQAEVFRELFRPGSPTYLNLRIIDKHVKLTSRTFPEKRGIFDFVVEDQETGEIEIIDLKLTSDIKSEHAFTPWFKPSLIDPIQLGTYKALYQETLGRNVRTSYMVFELNPRMLREKIDLNITPEVIVSINDRYRHAYRRYEGYMEDGFEIWRPHEDTCKGCPLSENCDMRIRYHELVNFED